MIVDIYAVVASIRYETDDLAGLFQDRDAAIEFAKGVNIDREDALYDFCFVEYWGVGDRVCERRDEDGLGVYVKLRD